MDTQFKFYKYEDNYLFSLLEYKEFTRVSVEEVKNTKGPIYYLNRFPPINSRKQFTISNPSLLFMEEEGLNLIRLDEVDYGNKVDKWLLDKIDQREVSCINTSYPNWKDLLNKNTKDKWKVNLIALGDVGSTLAIGLRLLGGDCISEIGIYDRNINRLKRWEHELNQIKDPADKVTFPKVLTIEEDDLFNCDMFIFCASKGVPAVGSEVKDVRMVQFQSNSEIISQYAKLARDKKFKGIFAVVSDPVDLLCKVAFLESNKDSEGNLDFQGLSSDQIIGYGLGVMNGRAAFYAEKSPDTILFLKEGRLFGPHGEGLIVADSIENYNEEISSYLTERTVNANKVVRSFGYKPYIAPSLSSGALSIIATIRGDWFYGSTYIREVYMGARCRLMPTGIELEQLKLPESLFNRIQETYDRLAGII
ncbi:MAG: lactate dehydrogenase [Tissierellia bacterium]|nr:lactate dehydrogenase [Tissierellia bacterium]